MSSLRRRTWLVSLAVPLLLALGLSAGCGGGGNDETAVSKATFLKEAGAACKHAKAEKEQAISKGLASLGEGEPSKSDLEHLVETGVVPAYQELLSQLRELEAPAGDQKPVATIVADYEAALQETEDQPGELIKRDPFTQAESAAQKYGLAACVF